MYGIMLDQTIRMPETSSYSNAQLVTGHRSTFPCTLYAVTSHFNDLNVASIKVLAESVISLHLVRDLLTEELIECNEEWCRGRRTVIMQYAFARDVSVDFRYSSRILDRKSSHIYARFKIMPLHSRIEIGEISCCPAHQYSISMYRLQNAYIVVSSTPILLRWLHPKRPRASYGNRSSACST